MEGSMRLVAAIVVRSQSFLHNNHHSPDNLRRNDKSRFKNKRFVIKLRKLFHMSNEHPFGHVDHTNLVSIDPDHSTGRRTLPWRSRYPPTHDGIVLNRWNQAQSWSALLNLNREFLRGETHITPFSDFIWLGGIKEPLPRLLTLHNYGLLTLASQASASLPLRRLTAEDDRTGDVTTTGWERIHQRAYLIFAIPSISKDSSLSTPQVRAFLETLLGHKKLYANVLTSEPA